MGAAVRAGCSIWLAALMPAWTWAAGASADRLLLQGPGAKVRLEREVACGESVRLLVDANVPEVFGPDRGRLQGLIDGARAILAFECARLPEVEVQGWLAGISEPVYSGRAGPEDRWLVHTERSLRSAAPERPVRAAAPSAPQASAAEFSVVGIRIGMTVEQASAAVAERFSVRPWFDPKTGVLSMWADGCPEGYDWKRPRPDPEPAWKCLRAWFSEYSGDWSLEGLELVQVVASGQRSSVRRTLDERFGTAAAQWSETGSGLATPIDYRVWGAPARDFSARVRSPGAYPLSAALVDRGDAVVVVIRLGNPEARVSPARTPDFKL